MGLGGAAINAIPPRKVRKAHELKPLPKHAGTPRPDGVEVVGTLGKAGSVQKMEAMMIASLSSGISPMSKHSRPRRRRLCPLPPLAIKKLGGDMAVGEGAVEGGQPRSNKPILEPLPVPVQAEGGNGGSFGKNTLPESPAVENAAPETPGKIAAKNGGARRKRRSSIGEFEMPENNLTPLGISTGDRHKGKMLLPVEVKEKKKKKPQMMRTNPMLQVGSMARLLSPPKHTRLGDGNSPLASPRSKRGSVIDMDATLPSSTRIMKI